MRLDYELALFGQALRAELALALFPTIPADLKALRDRQSQVREAAAKRLESRSGFTAAYLKYHSAKITDPEVRNRYERMCEKFDLKWKSNLSDLWMGIQWELAKTRQQKKFFKSLEMIATNLSKLSAEDLKLVEEQKYCPICDPGCGPDPLGCRGVPVKITLDGQTVFLCSKDCIKKAKADPKKTLANVESFKKLSFLTKKQIDEKLKQMSKSSDDDK
jgi:hypothetical protein